MIVFTLKCGHDHRFEAWFKDGAAYEAQAAAGEISCPVCGDVAVSKAPMAPNVATGRASEPEQAPVASGPAEDNPAARLRAMLVELRRHVEANFDNVGERFPEEARRIHYGETEARAIYGDATPDEAKALEEEGIAVSRIPWLPRET